MPITARDIMTAKPTDVNPEMTLTDLDQAFLDEKVGGFPVVDDGRLVGFVTRSDIVRRLALEQTLAENLTDYYRDTAAFSQSPAETLAEIAHRVGERIEHLRVKDAMVTNLISVPPDHPVAEVAKVLSEYHIHRVLVIEGDKKLVGIISTIDLVKLIAEGRMRQ